MKLIFTQQNRLLVNNARNIVESAGIDTVLKNEYASGAAGDLSPFDTWLELWVVNDEDYDKAMKIIEGVSSNRNGSDWICSNCGEKNDASFDICWKCLNERHDN